MKTPMAWAADWVDRHHAIGADRNEIESGRTPTCPAADQPRATAIRSGIIISVPIDPVRCQVDSTAVVGKPPQTRPRRPPIITAAGGLQMEPTAAHEGDRFAQGGRHCSEKLFIGMERHRHTPSP
jgi:hypothetical protein